MNELKEQLGELLNYQKVLIGIGQLVVAALLGAAIAFHPRRRPRPLDEERQGTARSQILMAVASALMVQVIGDSMARAFGLVGLGSSIRFRTDVRSPVDAAVLFLSIGIGMATGMSEYRLALVATAFIFVALYFVEPARREVLGHDKKAPLGDKR